MNAPSGRRRTKWAAGILGLAAVLLGPASAFAIFPPIYHNGSPPPTSPPPTTTPPPSTNTTGGTPDPGVNVGGEPEQPPPTATTPEPATLVTGLIGLLGGGYLLRRRNKERP